MLESVRVGMEREALAYEYLKERYDKVEWISKDNWWSPYDFIVDSHIAVEVRTYPWINKRKRDTILKEFDMENIIFLIWDGNGSFNEFSLNEIEIRNNKKRKLKYHNHKIINHMVKIGDVAIELKRHIRTLEKWEKEGKIKFKRIPFRNDRYMRRSDLDGLKKKLYKNGK